jgi:hypothetical protein
MSDLSVAVDEAARDAIKTGHAVIRGDEHHVLLDLDTDVEKEKFNQQFPLLAREFDGLGVTIEETARWKSKSGIGEHSVLRVSKPLVLFERLLIQSVLGSDQKRELLAYSRVLHTVDEPCQLFKPGGWPVGGRRSPFPTPWATKCVGDNIMAGCGVVYMTKDEYTRQLSNPDSTWRCSNCGCEAAWSDFVFQAHPENSL